MAESIMLDKAKDFAVEIINMCKNIKEMKRESVLTNQLMHSGTSIGANIHESKYAYEKAEQYTAEYDTEHTNPKGELVKTEKVEFADCFLAFDEEGDVQEIYSSTTKNKTSLTDEQFYIAIRNQCTNEELYDLRYEEFNKK